MLDDLIFVVKDLLVWVRRRLFLLAASVAGLSIMVPFLFAKAIFDHAHGNNWFADPRGKPGLFQYGMELMSFALGTVFLRTKPATEDAYAATKSASIRGSGDGVSVEVLHVKEYPSWRMFPGDSSHASGASKRLTHHCTCFEGKVEDVHYRGGFCTSPFNQTEDVRISKHVVVLMEDYLEFQSPQQRVPAQTDTKDDPSMVGVIIVPGALISPFAYSILARDLARRGYPSFVLRLPFDLAFYGWSTAGRIIKRPHKQGQALAPTKWVLVGHSLGASGVQRFTDARPECVDGVVFLGGGHLIGGNLAKLDIPSLLIWGSRDPFTPTKKLKTAKTKMPVGADSVVIQGGNHMGFASYSRQPMDWEASITREEQRQKTVEALVEFIERRVVP